MKKQHYKTIIAYVGKMKPIGQGCYTRRFAKSEDKPKEKVYIDRFYEAMFKW